MQACLHEARGAVDIASARLREIYGSSSGDAPVEAGQDREDDLSPDEYLLQEQGIYKEHRHEALVATRAWQKAASRYGPPSRQELGRYPSFKFVLSQEEEGARCNGGI